MIEEIILSKTGLPIAYVRGVPIHSLYDPIREAERFVESRNINQDHTIILLIAPGLCYSVQPLRKLLPGVRIIALQCSSMYQEFFNHEKNTEFLVQFKPDSQWSFSDEIDLYTFLENEIDDYETRTTRILEWRPATKAYGSIAVKLLDSVADYLKRAHANAITSERFGKKWIRNSIRFIHGYKAEYRILNKVSKSIVVMASGPSLEDYFTDFQNSVIRNQFILMALSSAVDCLLVRNIIPDVVVATDGGNWAKFHLIEAVRKKLPLAISVSGALPSQYFDLPLYAICDGTRWQHSLLKNIAVPVLIAPQRGTVAATAIDLALTLTDGEIYITGLDLGVLHGQSHARPNALERFHDTSDTRTHPVSTGNYQRYLDHKQAASLNIYARWFSEKSKTYKDRLVVLGRPNPALSGFRSIRTLPIGRKLDSLGFSDTLHEIPTDSGCT